MWIWGVEKKEWVKQASILYRRWWSENERCLMDTWGGDQHRTLSPDEGSMANRSLGTLEGKSRSDMWGGVMRRGRLRTESLGFRNNLYYSHPLLFRVYVNKSVFEFPEPYPSSSFFFNNNNNKKIWEERGFISISTPHIPSRKENSRKNRKYLSLRWFFPLSPKFFSFSKCLQWASHRFGLLCGGWSHMEEFSFGL